MIRLTALAAKPERLVIGLMSGTSVDGTDPALVRIQGGGPGAVIRLEHFATYPWSEETRQAIFRLFRPESSSAADICRANFVLGECFAAAALQLISDAGVTPADVDLIGSHGQTIWHEPQPVEWGGASGRSTLQIGEAAVIAERTGVVTLADFRVRDMAAGGQGAPLVPYMDYCLLRDDRLNRATQNIGGIGNVTYLPAGCDAAGMRAFDTGPGNMIIDALVSDLFGLPYDEGGAIAAAGQVDKQLLAELLAHPYFPAPPPKTTGRELFGVQFARELLARYGLASAKAARAATAGALALAGGDRLQRARDLVATATAFTAHTIADAYRRFLGPVDEVVVGGGGARNPVLLRMLGDALPGVRVMTHEAVGIDSDAKEAIAFALLANDCLLGLTTNVSGATGGRPAVLGKVSL